MAPEMTIFQCNGLEEDEGSGGGWGVVFLHSNVPSTGATPWLPLDLKSLFPKGAETYLPG